DGRLEIDGNAAQLAFARGLFGRLRLMLSEGLDFTHDSGWRRSCWEPGCCVVALTLTKVGKAGVKIGGNSSVWGGFFGMRAAQRRAVAQPWSGKINDAVRGLYDNQAKL